MFWLTWRQHRQQALAGAIALGGVALFLVLTHMGIARTFTSSGLAACLSNAGRDCGSVADTFTRQYRGYQFLIPLFLVVPMLVGLFWGTPLVARELESGTHRLIWTQSVTRRRWLSTKLVLVGAAVVAGAAAFAGLVSWWSALFVRANDERFTPGVFDVRGIVPIAYVLFAVALGVAAGVLIRRTLPAMAATLGGFVAVRALVTIFARPHYMAARTASAPIFAAGTGIKFVNDAFPGAWILNQVTLDRAGALVSQGVGFDFNYLSPRCPGVIPPPPAFPKPGPLEGCVHRLGIHVVSTYQPAGRFWAFQGIEFAIYAALAAALIAVSVWVVRRRIA